MQVGFIFILIIAIFIAIFAIQNGTPVPVDLFFARYEMPLAVIMMICLILGAVIVLILGTTRQFKKRSEQKELANKIKTFETEKAQHDISVKALESEKQNLIKTNEELSAKIAGFEDKIKEQEELLAERVRELKAMKAQSINITENVTEIIDEGAAETDNENSEVENQ